MKFINICAFIFLSICPPIFGYGMPLINLGGSSFLDGGPLRQIPGWYFQFSSQDYHAHQFVGPKGVSLCVPDCPHFDTWLTSYQLIYLSTKDFIGLGNLGFDITLPIAFYSKIQPNSLGIASSGAGMGDLAIGVYAQALPTYRNGRPVYVHRFEFVASFPTGKDKRPLDLIDPGNGVFYINPYWAGTAYFTPRFSATWRAHYLWVSTHPKTHLKVGDAIHANFALEYQAGSNLFLGVAGYFLEQLKDNTVSGVKVPHSREQVLGLGPGFLYELKRKLATVIIANLYFETAVRNRSEGIKFVFRYYTHF